MDSLLENALKRFIKHGVITSVLKNNTARVQFSDFDGIVSYDLPILVQNAGKNKSQSPPDVGCSAVCLMLPTGHSDGFVLGCYYDGQKTTPISDLSKKLHWTFEDGTVLEYDVASHKLFADVKGVIDAKVTQKATIQCPDVLIQGNVRIEGTLDVVIGGAVVAAVGAGDLTINGKITSTKDITIKGGDFNVTGDITSSGNIKATGTVSGSNL